MALGSGRQAGAGHRVVARLKSDERGRFTVTLSPGSYVVLLKGWGSSASTAKVNVAADAYPQVSVTAHPF